MAVALQGKKTHSNMTNPSNLLLVKNKNWLMNLIVNLGSKQDK